MQHTAPTSYSATFLRALDERVAVFRIDLAPFGISYDVPLRIVPPSFEVPQTVGPDREKGIAVRNRIAELLGNKGLQGLDVTVWPLAPGSYLHEAQVSMVFQDATKPPMDPVDVLLHEEWITVRAPEAAPQAASAAARS